MMETVFEITSTLIVLAALLSFVRLVRGPHAVDRVMCLDYLALAAAGLIAVHAATTDEPAYLDAVVVLSIIAFFGTIVFGRLIERRGMK